MTERSQRTDRPVPPFRVQSSGRLVSDCSTSVEGKGSWSPTPHTVIGQLLVPGTHRALVPRVRRPRPDPHDFRPQRVPNVPLDVSLFSTNFVTVLFIHFLFSYNICEILISRFLLESGISREIRTFPVTARVSGVTSTPVLSHMDTRSGPSAGYTFLVSSLFPSFRSPCSYQVYSR